MSAPSPGILAMAVKNEHYDTLDAYLAALGRALQVEYEAIVRHGFLLQIDAPDLALERHITYKDEPVAAFVDFVERVVATINRAIANVPRERVRLHVCWGNRNRRTTATCRSRTSCRPCSRPRSAASCCRSPIRATPTSSAASRSTRSPTISSWSPA